MYQQYVHPVMSYSSTATGGVQPLAFQPTVPASSSWLPNVHPMTAIANVVGPQKVTRCRIFFDSGADVSFIRTSVAESLDLPVVNTAFFACVGIQGRSESSRCHQQVSCYLQNLVDYSSTPCHLWCLDTLTAPLKPRNLPIDPALNGLFIADDGEPGLVDVIIGTDLFYSFVLDQHIKISSSMRAIQTSLGWVLHGRGTGAPVANVFHQISAVSVCRASLESMWELEGIGISPESEPDEISPKPSWDPAEGKYMVSLLWKGEDRPVSNYGSAAARVARMFNRLTPDQNNQYDKYMEEKISKKIIGTSPDNWKFLHHQFFLPHRAIFEGKFKIVFDGSALDGSGNSLNSYLVAGPNLLPKLISILIRFRTYKCGIQADIEGAFHQISISPEDRPFIQFTYRNKEIRHFRRAPFGLICSPTLLHATIDYHLSLAESSNQIASVLKKGLYFDDVATGFDCRRRAECGTEEAVALFRNGGMALHKIRITGDELPPSKLLGLLWDTVSDNLFVPLFSSSSNVSTKRDLLSHISKLWDPLGLLNPWSIQGKLIFQETWSRNIGWDETLPPDLSRRFYDWISQFQEAFPFPRVCITSSFRLECYVDASLVACCVGVYLVHQTNRHLLASKTRLAPISKKLSIPRLELIAALIGVRFVNFVVEALQCVGTPESTTFFSDSQDTLYWLQEKRPTKLFVSNRVKEILSSSSIDNWCYVSTKSNPADLGTRGVSLHTLASNELWWHGPASNLEPIPFNNLTPSSEAFTEFKILKQPILVCVASTQTCPLLPIFPIENASSLCALISRTAWLKRFISNCRLSSDQRNLNPNLSSSELNDAKLTWIRIEQSLYFGFESIPKSLSPLKPFCREGIIYSQPRNGDKPVVILPPESYLTHLVISDGHRRMFHQGAAATSSYISADYHVARSTIKRSLSKCGPCRRFRGLPYHGPEGSLPSARVEFTRTFARVGIDFFGPLMTENEKSYGLIFTCFSSRAVHLEAVESQSSEHTLIALRRFFALRGEPIEILSDNAKTFKSLSRVVPTHIHWGTIPERSPWWGGFYERLIGLVKTSLKISFHKKRMTFSGLQVTLYEIAFFLNLRPLTKFNDEVLCPASFLYGVPGPVHVLHPSIFEQPQEHWRMRKSAILQLKIRFHREYLTSLRTWRNQSQLVRIPQQGEVVLIHDSGPRQFWKFGIVDSLIPGRDGFPRAAFVKFGNIISRRALDRLYCLEGNVTSTTSLPNPPITVPGTDSSRPSTSIESTTTETDTSNKHGAENASDDEIRPVEQDNESNLMSNLPNITRRGRVIRLPRRYL